MKSLLTLSFLIFSIVTMGQQDNIVTYCGTYEAMASYLETHPDFVPETEDITTTDAPEGVVYVIPVVFHIVHNYGVENISDAQIMDALRILNEDFRMQNADTSSIIPAFKGIAADSEIEFRLAQKDPFGNCTKGINRIVNALTYSAGEDVKGSSVAPAWTSPKYLNIWVVNTISSGAAGYTFLPGSVGSANDGIIIRSNYVGGIGTSTYQRGRALTHEVGHWLNLPHTWGHSNTPGLASNCNGDDGVSDTPNTIGWTSCNLAGTSCSSLDNVQNYMDYSYCTNMFTAGQASRMRTALNSNTGSRNQLWTSTNLSATGTNGTNLLCQADFSSNYNYLCEGDQITFTDQSFHGATTWSWSFPGGTPSSSTSQNPTVTYNTAGNYSVTLTVGNGTTTKTTSRNSYIKVWNTPGKINPLYEGFEAGWIDPNLWLIENPDGGTTWNISDKAATGSWSAYIPNYNSAGGRKDALLSEVMDFSNLSSAELSFKVAYANRGTSPAEFLRVYVSGNCGRSWTLRFSEISSSLATAPATGSAFFPNSDQWSTKMVTSIPAHTLTDGFMLKFEFESDGGNNIFIDDINIGKNVGIEDHQDQTTFQVYPNPLQDGSVVQIELEESLEGSIVLHDVTGRSIQQLYQGRLNEGKSTVELPDQLAAGMYFIVFRSGEQSLTRKLIVN